MKRNRLLIACVGLFALTSAAQVPSSDVVIRSSVREVLLDVVVRDAHGRLITNLKPGEVTVLEDGVRQNVRVFRLVTGSEVRVEDEKEAAEAAAALQKNPTVHTAAPPFNPLRTVNAVCLILNDLNPDTRAFAFEAAKHFVNNELRPNTFIGVFSMDATGLRPMYPFSNNRERLLQAVQLAAVNQLPNISLGSAALINGLSLAATGTSVPQINGATSEGNADNSSPQDPLGTRGDMAFSVITGLREIDELKSLVRQLSPLPFQKTIVLMGTGLTRPPDQLHYWDSLIQSARTGGVTFYGVDVWGLGVCQGNSSPDCGPGSSAMAPSIALLNQTANLGRQQANGGISQNPIHSGGQVQGGSSPPGQPSQAAQVMELMHQSDYLRFGVQSANRQEAMRELSESTGGFLIANTNNTDKLLAHVMEEVDTHYELSYQPVSDKYDGHFRHIEVKLARAGLQAQTRSGYFALESGQGPVEPWENDGLKALDQKPLPHAFDFESKAYQFHTEKGTTQYAVAFDVPIANLTATAEDAAKKHRLHASLIALIKNAQGQVVDRISRDVPSDVADEHLAALQADHMTYEHAVDLAPGHYTIETAVVDEEGSRASAKVVDLDISGRRGLEISDIMLVRRVEDLDRPPEAADPFEFEGKRVLPRLSTNLTTDSKPSAYFVVYPDKENPAPARLQIEVLEHGQIVAQQTTPLPQPGESGGVPLVIATPSKPGFYKVQVLAQQGSATAGRTLTYVVWQQ